MKSAKDIIAAIGNETLQRELGVSYTAIRNAAVRGVLPAAWYVIVHRLCDKRGIACPPEVFSFKHGSQDRESNHQREVEQNQENEVLHD